MRPPAWPLLVCTLTACSSSPADVEGSYTMAITNRENGCNFQNWTSGESATGIGVTFSQEGEDVSATIEGATGTFVELWLGSRVYTGKVDGDRVAVDLFGNRSQNMGNCAFTYNSRIVGDASGDTMTGRVEYRAAGNGNPDCASIDGCLTFQEFNGTRPPQ